METLDGLRGIAIALVLTYHLHEYIPRLWEGASAFGETGLTHHSLGFFWVGVDLFYVLSGFFIGYAVLRPLEWRPDRFLVSRLTRILPAYYVSMAFTLLFVERQLLQSPQGLVDILMHVFMLHHLQEWTMFSINGPYWTLGIEFSFYLLMLALAPLWRMRRGWMLVLLFIAISLVWKASLLVAVPPDRRLFWGVQLPAALDEFAVGMTVAYALHRGWLRALGPHKHTAAAILALMGLALVGWCMAHYVRLTTDYWSSGTTVMLSRTVLCTGFALILASFILLNETPVFEQVVRWTQLQSLGRISYSLYLLHIPLMLLVQRYMKTAVPTGWPLDTLLVGTMLFFAWWSHRLIETRWHRPA